MLRDYMQGRGLDPGSRIISRFRVLDPGFGAYMQDLDYMQGSEFISSVLWNYIQGSILYLEFEAYIQVI